MQKTIYILIVISMISCGNPFVNRETSQIGNLAPMCLDSLAWETICKNNSVKNIRDKDYLEGLEYLKNHFHKPQYILYFDEYPKEIIGCDWYSVLVCYNSEISDYPFTGRSTSLSNSEQKRIRNRVLKELIKFQCEKGQNQTSAQMDQEVPFAQSHKNYPLHSLPSEVKYQMKAMKEYNEQNKKK